MTCQISNCDNSKHTRGVCIYHYNKYQQGKLSEYELNPPMPRKEASRLGGLKGKKDGTIKGFALRPELAKEAGSKGGKNRWRSRHV